MSRMSIVSQVHAYDDEEATSNPSQRSVEWRRRIPNLPVFNPSTAMFEVDAFSSRTMIDGARSLTTDGTTVFSLVPKGDGVYRILYTAGTLPGFRTARTLVLASIPLTVTVNANLTVVVAATGGTPFAAVEAGDVVFIPGLTTGDLASPFNSLNEGFWTVIGTSNTSITVIRDPSEAFSGKTEAVTPANNTQLIAYSPAGVQVGDTVELLTTFARTALRAYEVLEVTPTWISVSSTGALAAQVGIQPGLAGLVVHTSAKRYVQIEVDQEAVIRLNGDEGNSTQLSPWIPGNKDFPAEFKIVGNIWKLVIVNRSTVPMRVLLISAE